MPQSKGKTGRKQGRGDLSDAQWTLIEPLLPKQKRSGKWNDHRLMFDGILWILRTGAPGPTALVKVRAERLPTNEPPVVTTRWTSPWEESMVGSAVMSA